MKVKDGDIQVIEDKRGIKISLSSRLAKALLKRSGSKAESYSGMQKALQKTINQALREAIEVLEKQKKIKK